MAEPGKPVIPSDMKALNRALIAERRANEGKLSGPMAGRSVLLLTTKGARSGQPRTTVTGYGRAGEKYVVIASNNGAASHPSWYLTLWVHPARHPISALPAALLAYRSTDMRAALLAGALSSGADPATFGRTSGAGH